MSTMHVVENDQASTHYQVLTMYFLCKFATFIGLKTIVTHENVCLYYEANSKTDHMYMVGVWCGH